MAQQHLRVLLVEDSHGDQRLMQEWQAFGAAGRSRSRASVIG